MSALEEQHHLIAWQLWRFPDFYERYKSAGSTGATLATYGIESTRKSMVISAQLADRKELELLREPWPCPILSVESLYVDQRGQPVDHGVAHYAGDRIDLQID
jgi:DNA-binding GntR family transcriptional regulator